VPEVKNTFSGQPVTELFGKDYTSNRFNDPIMHTPGTNKNLLNSTTPGGTGRGMDFDSSLMRESLIRDETTGGFLRDETGNFLSSHRTGELLTPTS
jgi:hypothetical protein